MAIEVNNTLTIPDAELAERFSPSGGPGGQHANKASTRVELSWNVEESTALSDWQRERLLEFFGPIAKVVVDDERSQRRNRELAEQRLAGRVRTALAPVKARRSTRPTAGSRKRRLADKRQTSERKKLRQRPRYDD
ncbi:MAG: alternative ribosome rescue aminoacyl-tRNA hydrolase ArfB [Acidimicrobiales bacterium]